MKRLFRYLESQYQKKTATSARLFRRASKVMVRGGSHTLRLWKPYPLFPVSASGAEVVDVDGNHYLDYWQGHYANILGHNPEVVRQAVEPFFYRGTFHTGFETLSQVELAEKLIASLGQKGLKVRFTTSGTLAATYAVMLAMGSTGRDYILKVGGGWHGSSPYLLRGVKFHPGPGFRASDSAGLPPEFSRKILITRFNDCQHLHETFKKYGRQLAAFILEPFIGVGGFLFCSLEYLKLARELADRYGVVLIFDEIISGFRFCASGLQKIYGVSPDISLFGKLIGGGQAVAAVVGKSAIMEACEPSGSKKLRVHFEGGTFSSHEEYMRAGLAMLDYLAANQRQLYLSLGQQAERLRRGIEQVFREEGLEAFCTGYGNELVRNSSFFMVHFPIRQVKCRTPEDLWNPAVTSVQLREEALKLALLIHGVHVVHGGGCLSTAHTPEDISRTIEAYAEVARIFRRYL